MVNHHNLGVFGFEMESAFPFSPELDLVSMKGNLIATLS